MHHLDFHPQSVRTHETSVRTACSTTKFRTGYLLNTGLLLHQGVWDHSYYSVSDVKFNGT
jgi:hypothetical protein